MKVPCNTPRKSYEVVSNGRETCHLRDLQTSRRISLWRITPRLRFARVMHIMITIPPTMKPWDQASRTSPWESVGLVTVSRLDKLFHKRPNGGAIGKSCQCCMDTDHIAARMICRFSRQHLGILTRTACPYKKRSLLVYGDGCGPASIRRTIDTHLGFDPS